MTYKNLFNRIKEKYYLSDNKITYLLKYYLNASHHEEINISDEEMTLLFAKAKEISEGIPIQYVVGNTDFYGYTFNIEPGVLIPRFETEGLVEQTIKYIHKYFDNQASLIDVGTGSGIIGITIKKKIPQMDVTLVDISEKSLEVAKENTLKLGVDVDIYKSDMLNEVIVNEKKYDVLISNPPYLTPTEEIMEMVKEYEPAIALYGGDDGLKYYEQMLSKAQTVLKERALIAFEIGANQANDVLKIANEYFSDCPCVIKKDLTGRDRMFFLFKNLID